MVSGVGTISDNGVYTAPTSAGTAVIRAVHGSHAQTAKITVSGAIPAATEDCATGYRKRGPGQKNNCYMMHQEIGGLAKRRWHVYIPANYVAGQSGLIINIGGGGHGLDATNGQACGAPAGEISGWAPYLDTVPSPAPVLVCPQGDWRTPVLEAWNYLGRASAFTWVDGFTPRDDDFIRQLILLTVRDLHLDAKKVYITSDWISGGYQSAFAIQTAAANADLVAAIGTYNESNMNNLDTSFTVGHPGSPNYGQTLAYPTQPISAIFEPGVYTVGTNTFATMCGNNFGMSSAFYHPLTVDDTVRYFDYADQTTAHAYFPKKVGNVFCPGSFDRAGNGLPSDLVARRSSGGKLATAIYVYRFKGNATNAPWCSLDWNGNDTLGCRNRSTGSRIALDLRNSTCDWTRPCNPYLDGGTGPASASGYSPLDIFYKFFLAHPKP